MGLRVQRFQLLQRGINVERLADQIIRDYRQTLSWVQDELSDKSLS